MKLPNSQPEPQPKVQPRKFQYFTGTSTNNNLTSSSIDQHRNSIEQRIANLESKLAKKFNPEFQLANLPQPQSDNYVNTRRMYQNPAANPDPKKHIPPSSQSHTHTGYNQQSTSSGISNARQSQAKGNTFKYLANFDQSIEESALREKSKFSWQSNNVLTQQQQKIQPKDKLRAVLERNGDKGTTNGPVNFWNESQKERLVGKKIKNILQPHNQNVRQSEQRKYQSTQKFDRKYPTVSQPQKSQLQLSKPANNVPVSNPIINSRFFEQFNQLNGNISNLKQSAIGSSYPFQNYQKGNPLQARTISYDTGVNLRENSKNSDLYEMMKSIMVGQERLEKELIMLKQSKINEGAPMANFNDTKPKHTESMKPHKETDRHNVSLIAGKKSVPDSRAMSPIQARQEQQYSSKAQLNRSRSPHGTNHKSVSPQTQKSRSPAQNKQTHATRQTSANKRKRGISSVVPPKNAGKIHKNKQRFEQLYKQAQLNKRLGQSSSRIKVSRQAITSAWQKIGKSIKRCQNQDTQTSVIYHENNRWVNDQLVSKIELQKKLKNDLVRKVYEMCDNKCMFK